MHLKTCCVFLLPELTWSHWGQVCEIYWGDIVTTLPPLHRSLLSSMEKKTMCICWLIIRRRLLFQGWSNDGAVCIVIEYFWRVESDDPYFIVFVIETPSIGWTGHIEDVIAFLNTDVVALEYVARNSFYKCWFSRYACIYKVLSVSKIFPGCLVQVCCRIGIPELRRYL